jgi:hypothetical protein
MNASGTIAPSAFTTPASTWLSPELGTASGWTRRPETALAERSRPDAPHARLPTIARTPEAVSNRNKWYIDRRATGLERKNLTDRDIWRQPVTPPVVDRCRAKVRA